MDSAITGVFQFAASKKNREAPKSTLLSEIETVKESLNTVAAHFEMQSDPDLVEACIYEMKSLTARYRYLLREAKKEGITKGMGNILEHTTHS